MAVTTVFDPTRLKSSIAIDLEVHFPLAGGGSLVLGRGIVECYVSFLRAPEVVLAPDESENVIARLDVSDHAGHTYRLERELKAHTLLELIRTAQDIPMPSIALHEVLLGVQCCHDSRGFLPAVGMVDGRLHVLAFRAKHLMLTLDLLTYDRSDGSNPLIVRVHPKYGADAEGRPLPPTMDFRIRWTAMAIIWPSLLGDWYHSHPTPSFHLVDGLQGTPQAGVAAVSTSPH